MKRHAVMTCLVLALLMGSGVSVRAQHPSPPETASSPGRQFDSRIASAKKAMMTDPETALRGARDALTAARTIPYERERTIAIATAQWLCGEALIRLNQPEKAEPLLEEALHAISSIHPGSKLHGDLAMSRGALFAVLGRIQPALQDFQRAHDIFRAANDPRSQAIALQNIGSIYADAGDYPRVLKYFAQSSEIYDGDPSLTLSVHNNRAFALKELGRFGEAESESRLALRAATELASPLLEARILTNIAQVQLLGGKLAAAEANIARGFRIADRNPSAAGWKPFLWGVAAQAAAKRGQMEQAARLLDRAFEGIEIGRTSLPYRDFHETAYNVYAALDRNELALAHLEAYKRLDDEARTLAASTNAALMAARFDFANQDLRIARLKAGQLQRDILLARSRERLHATVLAGFLTTAVIVFSLLSFGFFRIRRSRNEVRAANAGLSEANQALAKALKAKTEFLATTSHEIRTPLNGILGMTQVILADRQVASDLREKIELVHGAGETMRALVDDILDVAKMETGHLTIHRDDMDLRRVLEDAAHLWRGQAAAKGVDLRIDLEDCPERIVEDETRLRQIVFNLMSNALKFTDAGFVSLTVRCEMRDGGERLLLDVADSGSGIPADQLEEIFESFRQVDGGMTRRHGGTGLGLAICRNLAQAMGGDIGVSSNLGTGSIFMLDLPLTRSLTADAPAAMTPTESARPESLAECALLLIEANPLTQSVLRAVLAGQVRSIEVVADLGGALAALGAGHFDHILAETGSIAAEGEDPTGPVRTILEAAGRARLSLWCQDPGEERRAALLQAGVDQILLKPIAAGELAAALQSIWNGRETARISVSEPHQAAAE
ncbi:ATP-binding protein [Sphingomonas oleivorans]|uniref:ATP-binding protein n=1 Tax=Sphingomonas oleivorans TaxID=1735121 RepID=UPI0013FE3131|nr:ATP-binding protein [Sphingomonas oleivorans]